MPLQKSMVWIEHPTSRLEVGRFHIPIQIIQQQQDEPCHERFPRIYVWVIIFACIVWEVIIPVIILESRRLGGFITNLYIYLSMIHTQLSVTTNEEYLFSIVSELQNSFEEMYSGKFSIIKFSTTQLCVIRRETVFDCKSDFRKQIIICSYNISQNYFYILTNIYIYCYFELNMTRYTFPDRDGKQYCVSIIYNIHYKLILIAGASIHVKTRGVIFM